MALFTLKAPPEMSGGLVDSSHELVINSEPLYLNLFPL